ncbi:MAG: hypothetical protein AABW68_01680 [archaeon]
MIEHSTPHPEKNNHVHSSSGPKASFPIWGVVLVVIVGGILAYPLLTGTTPPAADTPSIIEDGISTEIDTSLSPDSSTGPDNTALSKAKYLLQLYTIDRDSYQLFEKAAAYQNESLEETQKFFLNCCDLESEEEIFAELPPISPDFSTIAYNFATGQIYQLDSIAEGVYKQPEFYFHTDQTALVNRTLAFSPWSNPQLKYWGDYGGSATPADQFGSVSKKDRKTFTAVVFVTNGWNIQNWVGMNMVTNASAQDYFDITISEEQTGQPYFLLGPTFPAFSKDWATKLTIEGTVKESTPPGIYTVRVNPIQPPKELSQKWSNEHLGIYVPYGGLVPDSGFITLTLTVTE